MSSASPKEFLTKANPPPPIELISGSVTPTAAAAATAASAALPPARYVSAAASAAYGVPAAAAKVLLGPIVSIIGYDTPAGTLAERVRILRAERSGGRRFNSATDGEILKADVADSYFHKTMRILRARGLEDIPVHAELAYKTSDPEAWFVVAGLDEVALLFEDVDVEVRAVPEGTICRPHEPILTLSGPYR